MSKIGSLFFARVSMTAAGLGILPLIALSGCGTMQVSLGMKVNLAKTPVLSMEANLPKNPGMAPGEKSPLVVTFAQPDGKVLTTEGKGKGKVMWKDLAVTATVVSTNKKGVLSLPRDPRISDGKTGHVTITAPSHPELHCELDIPLRYNVAFKANYSGANGTDGSNGTDGMAGSSGSMGSTDPNNPSAGGDGGNGTDGTNGGNGEDGGNAPPVTVMVTLRAGGHPLLQMAVTAPGHKKHFYLVDPQGGSLTVKAEGGSGGSGGKGGHGGAGGIGTPNGSDGMSGHDGMNGSDGRDGTAGPITVIYDPQVKPFLNVIHLSNPGGPQPTLDEEPVAPLW